MLVLMTGNPKKYDPFSDLLKRLEIEMRRPEFDLPERQTTDFIDALIFKALHAAEKHRGPCLIDDSGLLLDAYPGFPGPITSQVCLLLGPEGMKRLLTGVSNKAKLVCNIGSYVHGTLWYWRGEITGSLDPSRPIGDGPGPLTQWFIPDESNADAVFGHRRRALEAFEKDREKIERAINGNIESTKTDSTPHCGNIQCVFCSEFADPMRSLFFELSGGMAIRNVKRTAHFQLFPPLGSFVEGGLLLATNDHVLSMAHLDDDAYSEMEMLVFEVMEKLRFHYGCSPLIFEHAPLGEGEKGTCCVDHAHFNIFPVTVDVHDYLQHFPHYTVQSFKEMSSMKSRGGYIFLQDNIGIRRIYETGVVPSQYIRRIITSKLGFPERWHWRDYLGLEELQQTLKTLAD
jgi:inosine/xanthosine triphosphate pyrophosphatase family protein